jgi:hypothetical protein
MAVDYTVVIAVRQRFGDLKRDEKESLNESESGLEPDAPFVGAEKTFAFRCPSVDGSQFALLLFQALGVSTVQALEINGQTIFGGIPVSVDRNSRRLGSGSDAHTVHSLIARWNGNVMLVHPGVLQENNLMRIRAAEMTADNLDDFIIDNVVVVFKTRPSGGVLDPGTLSAGVKARKKKKKARASAKKRRR